MWPQPKHPKSTSIDSLIGLKGIVTEAINQYPGQNGLVKVDGEIWIAYSLSSNLLEVGTTVIIEDIHGLRLLVKKWLL